MPSRQLVACLSALCACAGVDADKGHFGAYLGYRGMTNDAWESLGDQFAMRFEGDVRPDDWPVWLAAGLGFGVASDHVDERVWVPLFGPFDQTTELKAFSFDAYLGAKHYFQLADGAIQPYVGGGGALVFGRLDRYVARGWTEAGQLTTFGGWAQVGVAVPVSDWPTLAGLDFRIYSGTSGTVFDQDFDNDFFEITLFGIGRF